MVVRSLLWPSVATILSLMIGAWSASVLAADAPRRPNFLVVLADNIGQDWFGCYGSDEGCTPRFAVKVEDGAVYLSAGELASHALDLARPVAGPARRGQAA